MRSRNPLTTKPILGQGELPKIRGTTFKTLPLDLSSKVRVKLDDRTTVWVKPGTDIEELKLKFARDKDFNIQQLQTKVK